MKKKNFWKAILIILIILISFGVITYFVNKERSKKTLKPILCMQLAIYKDGGTTIYMCPGYKVIAYNTMSGYKKIIIGGIGLTYDDDMVDEKTKKLALEKLYQQTIDKIMNESGVLNQDMEYIAVNAKTIKYLQDNEVVLSYLRKYNRNVFDATFDSLKDKGYDTNNLKGIFIYFDNINKNKDNSYSIKITKYKSSLGMVAIEYVALYNGIEWDLKQIEYIVS